MVWFWVETRTFWAKSTVKFTQIQFSRYYIDIFLEFVVFIDQTLSLDIIHRRRPTGSNWLHGAYTPDKPLKSNVTRPSLWGTMAPLVRRGLWRKLCYVRGSQDSNWRTTIRAPWDDDVRLIQLFNLATWLTKMMPRNILRIQLFKMIRNPFEIAFTTKSWCFMAQICHFFEKYIF